MNRLEHQHITGAPVRSSPGETDARYAIMIIALCLAAAHATHAAEPKIIRTPGGISPNPVVTSISVKNGNVTVGWQAFGRQVPPGSNVVYQVVKCPALNGTNTSWSAVASVTNSTSLTMPLAGSSTPASGLDGSTGFLQVQQTPAPLYAGADKCALCHIDTHDAWLTTAHAGAFETLKGANSDQNSSCLPCHTVGYGTQNGFKDIATTPGLAGVQCENCHGPAGEHALKPLDPSRRPIRTPAAELCGGCHSDAHHPTYEEWATSVHGTTQVPEEEFSDPAGAAGRMQTCGACHSASTRLALMNLREYYPDPTDFQANVTNSLPSIEEATSTGITCAGCHDPHAKTDHGAQLRFPKASKVFYSYNTGTNFAANFNEQVQTCGQCHNLRGATWTGTSRPPHHSPQYNILIGQGGYEAGVTNAPQSAHMDIETQCSHCHTHPHSSPKVTEATPNYMGHDFNPTMEACAPCHDEIGAGLLKDAVQSNVKKQISDIKGLLDKWATTKAPDALRQKYGALAWEFTNIGQLSTRTDQNPTGPTATEQKSIPDNIKQARYNLYLIEHDHSYGVHNGNYTRFLLKVARDQANAALSAP